MTPAPYLYIDTESTWRQCLAALRGQPRIAVDLEANSLYAYRERVCLIQISIPGQDYIVDPLADFELEGLGELLADPSVEKLFHACEYDLILMKREYDWDVCNLFDTMWAARVLGYKNMGLAWFLREFYDVEVSKKHQKANWGKRPLTDEQLDYAQKDTYYLARLRDDLEAELKEKGRRVEAAELFVEQCKVRLPDRDFDPERYRTVRGFRKMPPEAQRILRTLYIFRDEEACRRDVPPFKVLGNDTLIRIAEQAPASRTALSRIKGVTSRVIGRMGPGIIEAVKRGLESRVSAPKRALRRNHDPGVANRFERLSDWRKGLARQRGVESDVIISRDAMWEIARSNPVTVESLAETDRLGPHRLALHGEAIVEAMLPSGGNEGSET